MSMEEANERGWSSVDVVFVTGDAYVDHPSFAMAILGRVLEAAGFRDITPYERETGPGLGIHEMGGARMGRDPKTSILNKNNQVHGVPNVYVTDGAFMASASCVNPSLTYMAFTARAADHAAREFKAGRLS